MTSIFFLLSLITFSLGYEAKCPNYTCSTLGIREGKICANRTEYGIDISTCTGKDIICNLPTGMEDHGYCINKKKISSVLPGDYCKTNEQCMRGAKCESNVCKSHNIKCSIDEDCDVEMYCYNGKCKNASTAECNTTTNCTSNMLCHNKKCELLFSKSSGDNSSSPALCKSYFMLGDKCHKGFKLYNNNTFICNGSCLYMDDDKESNFSTPGLCGRSDDGSYSYCALGKGDFDLSRVISYIEKNNATCHIRKGPFCTGNKSISQMPLSFLKAYKIYMEITQPELMFDTNICVEKALDTEYWEVKNAIAKIENKSNIYTYLIIAMIFVAVISTVLLAVYIRKSRAGANPVEQPLTE